MFASSDPLRPTRPVVGRTRARGPALLILLGSLAVLNPLSIDMYLPGFPALQRAFGASYTQIELSLSAFFVGMILGQLVYGPLSDKFGRRRPLLFGLGLFCVASIGCALAPDVHTFIACRVLQALGGCAGMVTSRAIVRDLFERERAAQVFSLLMLITGLGPILGPSMGGLITGQWGWRTIFWVLAAAGASSGLNAYLFLPETLERPQGQLSLRGVFRSYRALLSDRLFMAYALSGGAVSAGMFAYITASPFVFIELYKVPTQHYGWIFGVNALGMMLAAQVNRRMLATRSIITLLRAVTWGSAAAGVAVWLGVAYSQTLWGIMVPLFAFLALLGFVFPNSAAGALGHQPCQRAGTAAAMHGVLQWAVAFVASLAVSQLHDGTARPMAGVMAMAGLLSLTVFRVMLPPDEH